MLIKQSFWHNLYMLLLEKFIKTKPVIKELKKSTRSNIFYDITYKTTLLAIEYNTLIYQFIQEQVI